VTFFDSHSGI